MYKEFKDLTSDINDHIELVNHRYAVSKKLGSGGFSEVYKAFDLKDMKLVALKVLPNIMEKCDCSDCSSIITEETLRSVMEQEVEILKNLNHPNIIRLIDYDLEITSPWLVIELANGGDLYEKVCEKIRFPEYETMQTIKEILSILIFLQERGVVHRDLKPENLLYKTLRSDSKLMLTDFGLSSRSDLGTMTTPCGTVDYSAPELLVNKVFYEHDCFEPNRYSYPVDVWSAGVICYLLLAGYLPFWSESDNIDEIEGKIIMGEYDFSRGIWSYISLDAVLLIQKMLANDPDYRISAGEAIKDVWFTKEETDFSTCTYKEDWTEEESSSTLSILPFFNTTSCEINHL